MVDGQLIDDAVALVRRRWTVSPQLGIILGTGLGELVEDIQVEETFTFGEIPGFTPATATGHRGRLVCGRLGDRPVVALDGRLHRYEGHDASQITRGVRLLHQLGAGGLIVSNASGGVNPELLPGDLLVMESHINLMFLQAGTRGQGAADDMEWADRPGRWRTSPYHRPWIETAMATAAAMVVTARRCSPTCASSTPPLKPIARSRYALRKDLICEGMARSEPSTAPAMPV